MLERVKVVQDEVWAWAVEAEWAEVAVAEATEAAADMAVAVVKVAEDVIEEAEECAYHFIADAPEERSGAAAEAPLICPNCRSTDVLPDGDWLKSRLKPLAFLFFVPVLIMGGDRLFLMLVIIAFVAVFMSRSCQWRCKACNCIWEEAVSTVFDRWRKEKENMRDFS